MISIINSVGLATCQSFVSLHAVRATRTMIPSRHVSVKSPLLHITADFTIVTRVLQHHLHDSYTRGGYTVHAGLIPDVWITMK